MTIHALDIIDWKGSDHGFSYPEKKFTEEQKQAVAKALHGIEDQVKVEDEPEADAPDDARATAFVLQMQVSGGTYVRSIVHDLGHAVGSAAHVVTLTRTRQAAYALEPQTAQPEGEEEDHPAVPWDVFERAIEQRKKGEDLERDADGWAEWERVVRDALTMVEERRR